MKIFFVVSRFPYPLEKGDKLRAYHQIRHLSKKHEIILACTSDIEISKYQIEQLKPFCSEIHIFPLSRTIRIFNLVRAFFKGIPFQTGYFYHQYYNHLFLEIVQRTHPDIIYCQLLRSVPYIRSIKGPVKVLDYMDTFSEGLKKRIKVSPWYLKPIIWWEYSRVKKYEARVFKTFQFHTIISDQDRQLLPFAERNLVTIIQNGVDIDYFQPAVAEEVNKYEIVFTGNMQYPPNIEAAKTLVSRIFPLLKPKFPQLRILIAGADPTEEVRAMADDNVTVTGWLEDIRWAYNHGKIFVAPLFTGTGLQNKILEAMACGLPCITTSLVNNAIGAKNGSEIVLANSIQEFADSIEKLLKDSEQRQTIGLNSREMIITNFSWDTINGKLEEDLELIATILPHQ